MKTRKPKTPRRTASRKSPRSRARRGKETPAGYVLRLFVTGASPRSARAVANIRRICEEKGAGLFLLEVVDIYQQPELARTAQLVAAPTLLKTLPAPERRMVGDLSDHARVLRGLGLAGKER